VGIVFEEGKSSVCFVNFMWVLHLRRKIQFVFCELYVGVAFEEKKSNVCFVNSMWVLQFVYLQSSGK